MYRLYSRKHYYTEGKATTVYMVVVPSMYKTSWTTDLQYAIYSRPNLSNLQPISEDAYLLIESETPITLALIQTKYPEILL